MAEARKVLFQSAPSATTLTDAYTVPGATQVVGSSLVVCNRGGTDTTYRLAVAVAGAVDATAQYLAYDAPIRANESRTWTVGYTLAATDKVRVYAGNANLSFTGFGVEIT